MAASFVLFKTHYGVWQARCSRLLFFVCLLGVFFRAFMHVLMADTLPKSHAPKDHDSFDDEHVCVRALYFSSTRLSLPTSLLVPLPPSLARLLFSAPAPLSPSYSPARAHSCVSSRR